MVEVPIEIIEIEHNSYHILVNVLFKGKPVRLLIDTGASKSVFDKNSKLCDGLATIKIEDAKSYSINQSIVEYGRVCFPILEFEGTKFKDIDFTLIDFDFIHRVYKENTSVEVNGILGGDFLVDYKAVIDYAKKKLHLFTK